MGGLRVIVFHLGTNNMDHWGWSGKVSWQLQLASMQEVKALYRSVRHFNPTCFIVFSAVLPRRCDWQHTQELYLAFNHFLQSFARGKHCGFMPTFTSFIYKDGPSKGCPIESLFVVRESGLHLNLVGARCLPIDSRWHYHQGSFIAWLLWLVLSIGAGKGCSKWADGGGLQMFALVAALVAAHQSWQHMGLCYKCVFWDEVYLTSLYVCRWSLSGLPTCQVGKVHVVELRALTTKGQVASLHALS